MRAPWPSATLLLIATVTSPLAAHAASQGAQAIEQGYVDYFGKAVVDKGIVSVAPDGEDYIVTWDLQKAFDLAGAQKGALRIGRFSYRLTPEGGGAWKATADSFPSLAFDTPTDKGRMSGALDLAGFRLDAAYDAARAEFLRSLVAVDSLAGKFHLTDTDHNADFDLAESGIAIETRAKTSDSGAGVDVVIAQSVKSLSETILAPPQSGEGAPVAASYSIGAIEGGAAISGLRAREIGDLWTYLVAHGEDADVPPELRPRLRATLPLWSDLKTNGEFHDLRLQTPMAEATLKTFAEKVGFSGLVADGAAEIGLTIDELTLKSPLLPPWADRLSPLSLRFDLSLAAKGLDKAAELALDDPNFDGKNDLSPQTQDKIAAVLVAGRPKLTLAPGRLTTPTLDLTFEGEASTETGGPSGRFTFTADGLDKTIALMEEIAKSEPDMQPAALGLVFVKGLATTGADGRLLWKVDLSEDGEVSVNGAPLPMAK
jgi:hypothetical protein